MNVARRFQGVVPVGLFLLTIVSTATGKYSGGTGEPNDPYQIATAADLIALGETPEDYDKHFLLTADIDLDPNLPGRKVFDKAVIAPDTNDTEYWFQGVSFYGVFDGNSHTISHLTIVGKDCVGLFGRFSGEVKNLGVVDVNVIGSGGDVGGLLGMNVGFVADCSSTGAVMGNIRVGGLVGYNYMGTVTKSYSTSAVSGTWSVGGLLGLTLGGTVHQCHSTGIVVGESDVGGLAGRNGAEVTDCYSAGTVSGESSVGGLVGVNWVYYRGPSILPGVVGRCYSAAAVSGQGSGVGGLVGDNEGYIEYLGAPEGVVSDSFWDTETSGQAKSAGGTGETTAEMHTAKTFLEAGWDFAGETANGSEDIWKISEGTGYPRLSWEKYSGGSGEPNDPYRIATAADLIALGETLEDYDKHFILTTDIDLDPNLPGRKVFDRAVIAPDTNDANWSFDGTPFTGVFNGNGHTILHVALKGGGYLGLFGRLGQLNLNAAGEIRNLGVMDVNITGSSSPIGGLVGSNGGTVTQCYNTGAVSGGSDVGGLVGYNDYCGVVTDCYSTATVSGTGSCIGGLVGENYDGIVTRCFSSGLVSGGRCVGGLVGVNVYEWGYPVPVVTQCYSTGAVTGDSYVGGLVGSNGGRIATSYSSGSVSGTSMVGGLVGSNRGSVFHCYSTGVVSGKSYVGGLVGSGSSSYVDASACFWDTQTSGQATSAGGTGKTTAEMQDIQTFLTAGWDFADEVLNGTCDYWQISPDDYPRLRYHAGNAPLTPEGRGTAEEPYLIRDARDLGRVWFEPLAHYRLAKSVDLSGMRWSMAVIPWFGGVFDGHGYVISNLHIQGTSDLGLFGELSSTASVSDLGLEAVEVIGTDVHVGGLVGSNGGRIAASYSTGSVTGTWFVGGLVGLNYGRIATSYSNASVSGTGPVAAGLVGGNRGAVTQCYSIGVVSGQYGLVGFDNSDWEPGPWTSLTTCFWDTQTSGQAFSANGIGKTTAEMQTAKTFLDAGWDFVGETANGTEDIWWIDEGKDYPRLWWELGDEASP